MYIFVHIHTHSMMVVQSATIPCFWVNPIPVPCSVASQQHQSNSNAVISPTNVAAHNSPSKANKAQVNSMSQHST